MDFIHFSQSDFEVLFVKKNKINQTWGKDMERQMKYLVLFLTILSGCTHTRDWKNVDYKPSIDRHVETICYEAIVPEEEVKEHYGLE